MRKTLMCCVVMTAGHASRHACPVTTNHGDAPGSGHGRPGHGVGLRKPLTRLEHGWWLMPSENEIQRLAAATNQIRPEWPVKSLVTFISRDHAARPYRDLAVALAWIATDARTKTPARLSEAGPWWTATSMTEGAGPGQSRMRCATHESFHAGHCPECVAASVPRPADFEVPQRDRRLKVWQAGGDGPWTPADAPSDLQRVRDSIDAATRAATL